MHVALWILLSCSPTAAKPTSDNFDFSLGTLHGWKGEGFYLTTAQGQGPSRNFAVCSSDCGTTGVTGLVERTFTVSPRASSLSCKAYAFHSGKKEGDVLVDIRLETEQRDTVPKKVRLASGWQATTVILPPDQGKPREYVWDLSPYRGQTLRLVLVDDDKHPNSYLYCTAFHVHAGPESEIEEFGELMVDLSAKNKLSPVSRFDSKHFTAFSNADDEITRQYLRHCEMIYNQFLDHFRRQGFPIVKPANKMMVAIFDSQAGFDAYLGRSMPSSITGLFDLRTNRLVVFDYASNPLFIDEKQKVQDAVKNIASPSEREKASGATNRQAKDFRNNVNIGTIMHETGHLLAFNTGLHNRLGDVPVWLAEGLACYCEPVDHGTWKGIGEPNDERLQTLVQAVKGGQKLIPLRDLVSGDAWAGNGQATGPNLLMGYAQSWALFKLLMEERPKALRAYLKAIETRNTPKHRLTDFCAAFGSDINVLEERYQQYVADQIRQSYRPKK